MMQNDVQPMRDRMDLRVRRTRKLLHEALIALTLEKGVRAVTISDIAQRAMVNRATVYRHYQDKDALVLSTVTDLLNELELAAEAQQKDQQDAPIIASTEAIVHVFEHMAAHRAFYRALIRHDHGHSLARQIRKHVERILRRRLLGTAATLSSDGLPLDLIVRVTAATGDEVLFWWLEQDELYPPTQVGLWFAHLVETTLSVTISHNTNIKR
jgi:AcrR family transcriptional regulator